MRIEKGLLTLLGWRLLGFWEQYWGRGLMGLGARTLGAEAGMGGEGRGWLGGRKMRLLLVLLGVSLTGREGT